MSVAFSPDGQRLASGSGDSTVKIWDAVIPTGEERLRREAYALVQSLYSELIGCADVLDRLQRDATLNDALRREALSAANQYIPDPEALNKESWGVRCGVERIPAGSPTGRRGVLFDSRQLVLAQDAGGGRVPCRPVSAGARNAVALQGTLRGSLRAANRPALFFGRCHHWARHTSGNIPWHYQHIP